LLWLVGFDLPCLHTLLPAAAAVKLKINLFQNERFGMLSAPTERERKDS
jgi:hypothetical protein